jgi:ADP-sugar diphosphatase
MKINFECSISSIREKSVKNSNLLSEWLGRIQLKYNVSEVLIQSVDFKGGDVPLFIKLNATATTLAGDRALGICLLRGNAVAILPVLRCEGQNYLLLIRQSRFPVADDSLLEIPAGMLDLESNPKAVAVKEMFEETGFEITEDELWDLNVAKNKGDTPKPMWASSGLLDEAVYLYAMEREVNPSELKELDNRRHGVIEEGEIIFTQVIAEEDLLHSTQDAKTLLAYLLWKNKK